MSGKSGTMLPITANSSTGQFNHDGSCAWQRRTLRASPLCSAISTGPRQPSTTPSPSRNGGISESDALLAERGGLRRFERRGDAAGNDVVHEHPVPERRQVLAQHVFLQPRELRETEGEAAVVAEIAEIAQMIGNPLAFERERAQP